MMKNAEWKIAVITIALLTILDVSGILAMVSEKTWFRDNQLALILVVLTGILYYLIKIYEGATSATKETKTTLSDHRGAIENLLTSSLAAPLVRVFSDEADFKEYYIDRIRSARWSVEDLTWSHRVADHHGLEHVKQREDRLDQSIDAASEHVVYREIFAFNVESRKAKLIKRLLKNQPGYSCAYIDGSNSLPRIQYVLVDREEAIFTSNAFGQKFSIKNRTLVATLLRNFELAWQAATPLKHGDTWFLKSLASVLEDEVEAIRRRAERSEFVIVSDRQFHGVPDEP